MALTFWLYGGKIAVDGDGKPILCDECPCGGNVCNACDPPIPDTLYVTLDGLAGDFAVFNGKHTLVWLFDCTWSISPVAPTVSLWWTAVAHWRVRVGIVENCTKDFGTIDEECDPVAVYPDEILCIDAGCDDGNSCEDSEGATCEVTLV